MGEETTGEPVKKCQVIYTAPWGDQFVATVVSLNASGVAWVSVPEIQEKPLCVGPKEIKQIPKPKPERPRRCVFSDVLLGLAFLLVFALGFSMAAQIAAKGVRFDW